MKRGLTLLFVLLCLASSAKVWQAADVDVVYLKDSLRHVCDPEGLLATSAVDSMDLLLSGLERERGVQSVVVVVSQVADGDTYEFGMQLARLHGVGSKTQNTGLVVVLATADRAYSILTGTGLEGSLPDAICGRIERNYMVPHFKNGDWSRGMLAGVQAICAYVAQDETLLPDSPATSSDGLTILLVLLLVITVFGLSIYMNHRAARRCPQCGKGVMQPKSQILLYTAAGYDYYRVVAACPRCGHTQTTTIKTPHHDEGNDIGKGLLLGTLLGSLFGGRRGGFGGGGGWGGGSFGGGGFGGGGASGKF